MATQASKETTVIYSAMMTATIAALKQSKSLELMACQDEPCADMLPLFHCSFYIHECILVTCLSEKIYRRPRYRQVRCMTCLHLLESEN